jgi:hypothetical protein
MTSFWLAEILNYLAQILEASIQFPKFLGAVSDQGEAQESSLLFENLPQPVRCIELRARPSGSFEAQGRLDDNALRLRYSDGFAVAAEADCYGQEDCGGGQA